MAATLSSGNRTLSSVQWIRAAAVQGLECLNGEVGLKTLLSILVKGSSCAHLAASALAAAFSSSSSKDFEVLMRLGGVASILNFVNGAGEAFDEQTDDPKILRESFRCIQKCCEAFRPSAQDIVFKDRGGLRLLLAFACERGLLCPNSSLQLMAIEALSSAVHGHAGAKTFLCRPSTYTRIATVLDEKSEQEDIITAICHLLSNLVRNHEEQQILAFEGNIVDRMRDLFLDRTSSSKVQAAALSAMAALCEGSYHMQDQLRRVGALGAAMNYISNDISAGTSASKVRLAG